MRRLAIRRGLACLLLVPVIAASAAFSLEPPGGKSVLVLPIRTVKGRIMEGEMIDEGIAAFFERMLGALDARESAAVIIDMDTFGGRVDSAVRIADAIKKCPVPTAAFINNKAISAGSLIAISCERIYMTKGGSIGASTPVYATGEGMMAADEKVKSFVRAEFRARAESRGRNPFVAEAMVDPDVEVLEVLVGDERRFVDHKTYERLDQEARGDRTLPPVKMVGILSEAGKVLTLTAEEADRIGFIDGIVEGMEEVKAKLDVGGLPVVRMEPNWAEELARVITNPAIRTILLLVGLACIYAEVKVPGIGLPTAGAVICFGLLFFGHHVAGLADFFELLLFFVGVALLLIEIFLIPGFGITGVTGIVLILASLILIFSHYTVPERPNPLQWQDLSTAVLNVFIGFAGSLLVMVGLVAVFGRYLQKIPLARRLALVKALDTQSPLVAEGEGEALVGKEGRSLTLLRPVGKARFGETHYDVVSEGEFIGK
ncbi:MAG: hypothetical protein V2A58_09365, partial [Planctomycetota bacterium]